MGHQRTSSPLVGRTDTRRPGTTSSHRWSRRTGGRGNGGGGCRSRNARMNSTTGRRTRSHGRRPSPSRRRGASHGRDTRRPYPSGRGGSVQRSFTLPGVGTSPSPTPTPSRALPHRRGPRPQTVPEVQESWVRSSAESSTSPSRKRHRGRDRGE